jgi:hypothetical protein
MTLCDDAQRAASRRGRVGAACRCALDTLLVGTCGRSECTRLPRLDSCALRERGGCRPDRYAPAFGATAYKPEQERDEVPIEVSSSVA